MSLCVNVDQILSKSLSVNGTQFGAIPTESPLPYDDNDGDGMFFDGRCVSTYTNIQKKCSVSCVLCRRGEPGKQLEPNTWALPGGKLEFGESFESCAERELEEETGIRIKTMPTFAYAVNTVFDDKNHFVTIFMSVDVDQDVVVENREPHKHSDWQWVPWSVLKEQQDERYLPLMTPLKKICDVKDFEL